LSSLGFVRSSSELAIYTRRSNTSQLVVGVYVDDIVIIGPDRKKSACSRRRWLQNSR
jgi:hypothetical protein